MNLERAAERMAEHLSQHHEIDNAGDMESIFIFCGQEGAVINLVELARIALSDQEQVTRAAEATTKWPRAGEHDAQNGWFYDAEWLKGISSRAREIDEEYGRVSLEEIETILRAAATSGDDDTPLPAREDRPLDAAALAANGFPEPELDS